MAKVSPAKLFVAAAAALLMTGCATMGGTRTAMTAPLDGVALRRLFLNGLNTYLTPPQQAEGAAFHTQSELFRPNGTYSRKIGPYGPDGWYAIEGDLLCVRGDGIPKQCRKVIPRGGKTYLLIDVSDNSQALLELSQQKNYGDSLLNALNPQPPNVQQIDNIGKILSLPSPPARP